MSDMRLQKYNWKMYQGKKKNQSDENGSYQVGTLRKQLQLAKEEQAEEPVFCFVLWGV